MKKQQNQEKYDIDDFEKHCNLWNIVPGGSGKAILMLRKIVDCIQYDNYSAPRNKSPSFLLIGENNTGKNLVAKALANSLICSGIVEIPGEFFENGIPSLQFFSNNPPDTAHLITNVEKINRIGEAVLWKFLKRRECNYYNHSNLSYDRLIRCNGLIVMTARDTDKLGSIVNAVDHTIYLEPYSSEQVKLITHQILKVFCGVEYDGEQVLQEIVEQSHAQIGQVIEFLKVCLLIMKAEMLDCLTVDLIEKVKRMGQFPVPAPPILTDDIPF